MKPFLISVLFLLGLLITGSLLPGCNSRTTEQSALTIPTDSTTVAHGKELFVNNCSACHNFQQQAIGPALAGVTTAVEPDWLYHFIRNAPAMIDSGDARAVKLYQEYQQYMPPFTTLDSGAVLAIMGYLHTQQETAPAVTAATLENVLTDPIPVKIRHSGLVLVLEPVAQAPATRPESPVARINKMLMLPGEANQAERMFMHDLQGILYEVTDSTFRSYFNLREQQPNFIDKPGLGTGFGSFAFHPEFYDNGLLYTTHTEPAGTAPADYAFDDSVDVTLQWVLTEWKTDAPKATTFSGKSRELLRINMVTGIHGLQELTFNPTAAPRNDDYGLLYLGIGDGGATLHGHAELCQDLSRPWGTILRIDPRGNNSSNGQYGIPPNNPYAQDGDEQTLGEIFAYGFRNPHRISWDTGGAHAMLISGIGEKNAEELNLGVAGANYGWPQREGTFLIDERGDISLPYPLPPNDDALDFTYPVAQYDHDEGNAISGGFVYRGQAVPALQGKYVFGDIVTGRLFSVDADQLKLGQQAKIRELGLRVDGQPTTLREVTGINRVDLRFGLGFENELYLFTKSDGRVWKVTGVVQENESAKAGI
jgi:glucose/arabinose dehydrogenase/mono/diheme cytochrome c family protein